MRKLIILNQENLVQCDTEGCDYVIPNETKNPHVDTSYYIGMACPKCGANLLTQNDSDMYDLYIKWVDWINRWFSWITLFIPNKIPRHTATVHIHGDVITKFSPNTAKK